MTLFTLPLVLPRSTHYSRLDVPPEATAEEIRAAAARHDTDLKARGASKDEVAEAHSVNLDSSARRAEHDAGYPPLALLRLEPTWNAIFDDRAAGLAMLRVEIENFLVDASETVFHPTDISRSDFTADFTYCPLIDDPRITDSAEE